MAATLFEGASIGPLMDLAFQIDPSILITAFVGTGLAFACFSAAFMVAKCREYLYRDIIEKAHFGDLDYVKHALTLFTDFVAVFVRILIIMLKNSNEKKKKRRN